MFRHLTDPIGFQKHYDSLNPEQRQFVRQLKDWIFQKENDRRTVLVTGGPGTGKTHTVIQTLDFVNLKQLRLAFTGRLAERIGGRTIHSALDIKWWVNEGQFNTIQREIDKLCDPEEILERSKNFLRCMKYHSAWPRIVVIDEISMIAFNLLYWVLYYLANENKEISMLFVLIGDASQLSPVDLPLNVFHTLDLFEREFGKIHRIDLTHSIRFNAEYDAIIRNIRRFVDSGDTDAMVDYIRTTFPVAEDVDPDLMSRCHRALAFANEDVDRFNNFFLKHFVEKPVRVYRLNQENRLDYDFYVDLPPDGLVYTTQSNGSVVNGTRLVFKSYDPVRDVLVCTGRSDPPTRIEICRNKFTGLFPVVTAFAGTIHKFQGDTIDDSNVLFYFGKSRDSNLIYTALSRVKSMDQILAVVFGPED